MSLSLVPFPTHQRHTFTARGVVYEARYKELRVVAPAGASIVFDKHRFSWIGANASVLSWPGKNGPVKSTANEVFELAHTRGSGFRVAK